MGFDDISFAQFTQPALITVSVPRAEIGRCAFQLVSLLVEGATDIERRLRVETALVVRQTTAPRHD